jgi:hypothetical protein
VCFVSERTGDEAQPYRHGRLAIRFPTPMHADDGSTLLYRYRLMEEGAPAEAAPLAVANCRIPNTPRAVEFMDRRLGVDPRRRRSGGKDADDGLVTTLSCPAGGCVIEGITAIGYAQPRYPSGGGTTSGTSCAMIGCGTWDASYEYYSYSEYSPEPDPGTPGEPCNTGSEFLDDPAVNQGFDEMWKASNASANLAHRVEQMGWIVRTATGFRIQTFGTGSFCGWNGVPAYPAEGPDAIVGFIHTHPYTVGETIIACDAAGNMASVETYLGVPSTHDRDASVALGQGLGIPEGLAGIILDANGIRLFKGHDLTVKADIDRCGY